MHSGKCTWERRDWREGHFSVGGGHSEPTTNRPEECGVLLPGALQDPLLTNRGYSISRKSQMAMVSVMGLLQVLF